MTFTTNPSSKEQILVSEEAAWGMWFMCLPIWDRRTVHRHELEWHDHFVIEKDWSLADLRVAIDAAQGLSPKSETT